MKFRKKPVIIDAIEWTGFTSTLQNDDFKNMIYSVNSVKQPCSLVIKTLEGDMLAYIGDYIIRGVAGEYYPCKPEIFKQTYEEVN